MTSFGQLVVGAPGAGKSTYCTGLIQIIEQLNLPSVYVNLDPANDLPPYVADVDIRELITVESVMSRLNLGPNGALRYCMKTLAFNVKWLLEKIRSKVGYLIIDMPGQLELYNSDDSISLIAQKLRQEDYHLCAVHLSDSSYCSDAGKFISVILSSLSVMINMELPQINVLSKVDIVPELPYDIDFFANLPDLRFMLNLIDEYSMLATYKTLISKLCDLIEDYSLVSFVPLDVFSKERMVHLFKLANKANGFEFYDAPDLRQIVSK